MIEYKSPSKKLHYTNYLEYKGIKYVREEIVFLGLSDSSPDKPEYSHTISWKPTYNNDISHFYSYPNGWNNDDVPELELKFKLKIGRDLIYPF